jgi:hypothetical protein
MVLPGLTFPQIGRPLRARVHTDVVGPDR